jgi:hypothetical protein
MTQNKRNQNLDDFVCLASLRYQKSTMSSSVSLKTYDDENDFQTGRCCRPCSRSQNVVMLVDVSSLCRTLDSRTIPWWWTFLRKFVSGLFFLDCGWHLQDVGPSKLELCHPFLVHFSRSLRRLWIGLMTGSSSPCCCIPFALQIIQAFSLWLMLAYG